jgi:polysaccharide biosynthesis/export protein
MFFNRLTIVLCGTLLLSLSLFSVAVSQTQNGEQDRQPRAFQTIMGTDQIYFVDHVGLQLLQRQLPAAEYLQSEHFKLGPQDVLSVDVAGPIPITARGLAINSQGQVFIPLVGNVDVNELSLSEAHDRIEEALARELNEFELKVTIDRPRQVSVTVHGDIPHPGRYLVPAGTRLDAVVYASLISGTVDPDQVSPADAEQSLLTTQNFSLRNIRINRNDGDDQVVGDLINYFRNGDIDSNPYVFNGDRIRIPRRSETSPSISISGAVHSAQHIEYQYNDSIERLLDLAGGHLDEADRSRIVIHRTENSQTSKIELDLSEGYPADFELYPNDRIVVPYLEEDARSYSAWVHGEAIMPGIYPIQDEETTLADLLETAGGLTSRALAESAYIIRSTTHTRDVRPATSFNVAELQRTSDQLAQGFEYLQREEELSTENRVHVNLRNEEELNQIRISHGDRLYIPKDQNAVILYGQVNNPGNYTFRETLAIDDYLQKAGGMTIAADPERVFVIKAGSRAWKPPAETTLQSGDIIFVDRVPYDEFQAARNYDIQVRNLRRSNLQLVLTTVSTITAVVTTYVAITR